MNKYIVVEEKVENYFNDIILLGKILASINNNFIFKLFLLPSSRFLISGLISMGILIQRIKTQFYKNSSFDDLLLANFGTEFNIQHSNYKGSKCVKIKHCVIGCDRCENKNILWYQTLGTNYITKMTKDTIYINSLKITDWSETKSNFTTNWNDDILNCFFDNDEINVLKSGVGLCTLINTNKPEELHELYENFNILTTDSNIRNTTFIDGDYNFALNEIIKSAQKKDKNLKWVLLNSYNYLKYPDEFDSSTIIILDGNTAIKTWFKHGEDKLNSNSVIFIPEFWKADYELIKEQIFNLYIERDDNYNTPEKLTQHLTVLNNNYFQDSTIFFNKKNQKHYGN